MKKIHQEITSKYNTTTFPKTAFFWFQDILQQLKTTETETDEAKTYAAKNWFLIGEIYDELGAPMKASFAYQKAINYDPQLYLAYEKIVTAFQRTGQYKAAFDYVNLGLQHLSKQEKLMISRQEIQDCMNYNTEPELTEDNVEWLWCELLANNDFKTITKHGKVPNNDIYLLKTLAMAHGALEQNSSYLKIWKKVIHQFTEFEIEDADWFYMPKEVLNTPTIWRIFKEGSEFIYSYSFPHFDIFNFYFKEILEESEIKVLICDYWIIKTNNDFPKLNELRIKYDFFVKLEKELFI